MDHPRDGERVSVRPASPALRVQRGDGLHGQFLPPEGAECIWDAFLHRRWLEGAIVWQPLERAAPDPTRAAEPEAV